jgi:hypothetical protein
MNCGQASHCILTTVGCFIYDFQTLLTGASAIFVAVVAGIPVWRQLKDTNLQTRISHRETLATLMRDALARYAKVDKGISEPLSTADGATSHPDGEPVEIDPHDAHHLEQMFNGVLDWYLVISRRILQFPPCLVNIGTETRMKPHIVLKDKNMRLSAQRNSPPDFYV